jgi:hypothetical protein
MNSEYPISFGKDAITADGPEIIATMIAQLKEENEALRRLAAMLSAQLNLARVLSARGGQLPS